MLPLCRKFYCRADVWYMDFSSKSFITTCSFYLIIRIRVALDKYAFFGVVRSLDTSIILFKD